MFNPEQIRELLNNKNVVSCSPKSITFSGDFKLRAVKKYYEDGYSPSMIFKEAGINLDTTGRTKPEECLKRWRNIFNKKGEKGLMEENRGGDGGRKPKMKFRNKDEEIRYLRAKITYIDAENDFLAKLRGLKRK